MILSEKIAVTYSAPELLANAKKLANKTGLQLLNNMPEHFPYVLNYTPDGLQLKTNQNSFNPLMVDFLAPQYDYRKQHGKELLLKAIGKHSNPETIQVLDITAGLGQDAYLLACYGFKVTMLERNPIIHALTADGLARLKIHHPNINLNLENIEALDYLNNLNIEQMPDIIYFDPMHPIRKKSALVKKEMRMLQDIVGEQGDLETLLALSLNKANKRVVVKQPLKQSNFALKATHQILGKSIRFDVYMKV